MFVVYVDSEIKQKELADLVTKICEEAYFNGQKDVITEQNICIKFNDKTKEWEWIKSPWGKDQEPLFQP